MFWKKKTANEQSNEKVEPGFFSYENLKSLGSLIVIIFAVRSSIASPYVVPTASMEPTIKVGDRLLAWKLAFDLRIPFTNISILNLGKIKRGDIIVFKYPRNTDIDYVKRVVGLPGDKIKLVDDVLYINGLPQERVDHNYDRKILEDIKDHKEYKRLFMENLDGVKHWTMVMDSMLRPPGKDNWPSLEGYVTIPEDSVYVMGDNRDNSLDSRSWGRVPISYIRGRAVFVIWSMFFEEGSFIPKFRFGRFGSMLK